MSDNADKKINLSSSSVEEGRPESGKRNTEKHKTVVGICLLVFFTAVFIVGYCSGEAGTVLTKANKICLQCIGIG